jgi:pimeloyl-ACP methyl ester carboxylesterase
MNPALGSFGTDMYEEPLPIRVPEVALRRLQHRLGRAREDGEGWEASLVYGARPELVTALLDYWCDDFDFRSVQRQLNELEPRRVLRPRGELAFLHLRSRRADAKPLLWLHGYSSSIAELLPMLAPLTAPNDARRPAFHVVAPSLPGFGLSHTFEPTALATARECAALMAELGYQRYSVHGSDLGARIALELWHDDSPLTSVHVTSLACTSVGELDLATLRGPDKSRLASLSELYDTWQHAAPSSAVERLAFAACQLGDCEPTELCRLRDLLLAGLTLSELGDGQARHLLARTSQPRRERSGARLCVCSFPLAPPTLRGPAERAHAPIEWHEHERGGELAALEQPDALIDSLRRFHVAES